MRVLLICLLILGAGCDTEPELPTVASPWTKQTEPVWTGDIIASDPSVARDDDGYRMCYTCLDPATDRTAICRRQLDRRAGVEPFAGSRHAERAFDSWPERDA